MTSVKSMIDQIVVCDYEPNQNGSEVEQFLFKLFEISSKKNPCSVDDIEQEFSAIKKHLH